MRRLASFLIVVALIASMVGCGGNGSDGNGGDGNSGNGVQSYTLTIDSTAGGVVAVNNSTIPGKATFIFGAGTVVSLNATPESGYQFVKWTGDVGIVDNIHAPEITISVNGNYSIMASFKVSPPVQYMLAILSTPGGAVVRPGEGSFTYSTGTVVNLVATPARGYKFFKWSGDVDTVANVNATSTNITMNGDYYLCANFREDRTCG
jgi:hypothetical protein